MCSVSSPSSSLSLGNSEFPVEPLWPVYDDNNNNNNNNNNVYLYSIRSRQKTQDNITVHTRALHGPGGPAARPGLRPDRAGPGCKISDKNRAGPGRAGPGGSGPAVEKVL